MRYVLLVIIWIGWCTLHSALIRPGLTEWIRKRFPIGFRYYRIFYNLFAAFSLIPVVLYTFSQSGEVIVAWNGPLRLVPILLGTVSLVMFIAGACRYDFLQFLGLRQIKDETACSALTADCSLDTEGVLSVVRHPWYGAGILLIWARPLDMTAILTNLVVSGYFWVGALLEEQKLTMQFGEQYTAYRQHVSMLFPIKWAVRRFLRKK